MSFVLVGMMVLVGSYTSRILLLVKLIALMLFFEYMI